MKTIAGIFLIILPFVAARTSAQDTLQKNSSGNYYNMSLEELMNVKISVASVKELTTRESPGVVTLITGEDIKLLGARDLMDVLRTVPGFDFGMDVEGVIGVGVRGNWAHEGKILLLIDGQEMNENLYSSIQMGNHYPVNEIERIEIIRGPGSAIYGGYAEYAVINVISKKGSAYNGAHYSGYYGQMSKTYGHRGVSIAVGDESKKFSYTFQTALNDANRSQDNYRDVFGDSYNMAGQSAIKNSYVNLGLNVGGYQFRGITDGYHLFTRDAYQEILSKAYRMDFDSYLFELKKDFRISDRLQITPRINYKNQTPWAFSDESEQNEFEKFKIHSQRFLASVVANYDDLSQVNIIGGVDFYKNLAVQKTGEVFSTTSTGHFPYYNYAFYAQSLIRSRIANITIGARYNLNSMYDASFVPRLGITKVIDRFHVKLLFSDAFRAPNTQNIDLNPAIKPENTREFEMETGYELTKQMFITVNAFDISTRNPIVYFYDNMTGDGYANFDKSGTRGFEVDYKFKSKKILLGLNYAFYSAKDKNVLSAYAVPVNPDVLLAFPAHKVNATIGFSINEQLTASASTSFSGPRYGITGSNELFTDTVYKKFDPYAIVNFNLNYDNLFTKGLCMSFGIFNALDHKDVYIQPYNNLHAPLPANTREFVITVTYGINFKK